MSSTPRLMVGSDAIVWVDRDVAAPVRSELKTASALPLTVMASSSTLTCPITNCRSAATPSVRLMLSCTCRRYPTMLTVTR